MNLNISRQQIATIAKRLKISEDELKKQAQTQNEQENENTPKAGSVGVNDTEGSMQALDTQALLNAMLVNNKANETQSTTYTFNKSKKSQTIVVNGQNITVSATLSGSSTLTIVVGQDGKINVYSEGATAINFSKATQDLNINIEKSTANLTVTGGSGNDTITVQKGAKISKIDGGKGDDLIVNNGANNSSAQILGGDGNDIIFNASRVSKIDAGKGDDNIFNLENATAANIAAGDGHDRVVNFGAITTKLDAGAGNDNIFNYGTAKNITGAAGIDKLSGTGSVTSISTVENAGNDFSGIMNGKLYVNGQLAQGKVNGKMYKDGALATGVVDGKYYKSGDPATAAVSGKQYVEGELAQGLYNNKYYENGINNTKFTGEFEGKYVEKGKLYSGTKTENNSGIKTSITYKNGLLMTEILKNSKNQLLYQKNYTYNENGNLLTTKETDNAYKYSKSIIQTFEVKYENNQPTYVTQGNVPLTGKYRGLMFQNGNLFSGTMDRKYYVDGVKAHGIIYNNILYFDGERIASKSNDGIYYSNNGDPLNSDYYLDGKRRLFQDGVLLNGIRESDGKTYKEGILADNTTVDGKYYINGSAAQGIYNGKCYYDGYILTDDVKKTFEHLNSLDAEELEKSVGNNTLNVSKESFKNIYTLSSSKTSQTISVNGQQINVITKIASGGSIEIVIDENNNINVYSKGKNTISFEKATQNLCINIQQNTEGVLNVTGGKGNDIISVSKNATVNITDFSGNNIITNHGSANNINANGIIINKGCVDRINTGNANNRICNYGQVKEGIFCGSGIDSIEGSGKQNGLALIVNNVEVIADNVEGFVNGKYYKNGFPSTGEYKYYIPETKEHPLIDSRSYYFNKGELLTGLADNGKFYVKGIIYTGEYEGKWYYKGEERSQDAVIFLYNDEKGYYGAQEYPLLISVVLGNDYAEKVVNSKRELERFEAYYKNLAKRDGYESVSFGYTHSSAYKDWLKTPTSSRPPSMPAFVTGGSSFTPYTARWTINGYTFEHRISSANEYAYYDAYYANISSLIANATEAQLRNFLTRFKSTNANGVYSSGNSSINSGSSKSYSATGNGSSGRSSSTRRTNSNSNNTYFQSDVLPAQEYVIVNDSPIDLDGGGFHGDLYFTGGEAYIWNYEQNAYNLAALAYNDDETENPNPEDDIEDQEFYYEPYEFENFEELMMLLYAPPYSSDEELTPETFLPSELDLAFKPTDGLSVENYGEYVPTNIEEFKDGIEIPENLNLYDSPLYVGSEYDEAYGDWLHAIYNPDTDRLIYVNNEGEFINSIPDNNYNYAIQTNANTNRQALENEINTVVNRLVTENPNYWNINKTNIRGQYNNGNCSDTILQSLIDQCKSALNGVVYGVNREVNDNWQASAANCHFLAAINTFNSPNELKRFVSDEKNDKSVDIRFEDCTFDVSTNSGNKTIKLQNYFNNITEDEMNSIYYTFQDGNKVELSVGDKDVRALEVGYYKLLEENGITGDMLKHNGQMNVGNDICETSKLFFGDNNKGYYSQHFRQMDIIDFYDEAGNMHQVQDLSDTTEYQIWNNLETLMSDGKKAVIGSGFSNRTNMNDDEQKYVWNQKLNYLKKSPNYEYYKDEIDIIIGVLKNQKSNPQKVNQKDGRRINIPTDHGYETIYGSHAYAVDKVDDKNVTLINPHNNSLRITIPKEYAVLLFDTLAVGK